MNKGTLMRGTQVVVWPFLLAAVAISTLSSATEELKLAYASDFAQISTHTVLLNERISGRVNEIGQRLVKASRAGAGNEGRHEQLYSFTFRIMNDPIINAFSVPAGYIYVNTGLLDILQSEEELAAVLAHEIHHVNGRHLMKQINNQRTSRVVGSVAGFVFGTALGVGLGTATQPSTSAYGSAHAFQSHLQSLAMNTSMQFGQAMGGVMTVSMVTGYSKSQELEADAKGLEMMKAAGYDPQGMVSMFKRFIEFRNKLGKPSATSETDSATAQRVNYTSSLINAQPGLDERLKQIEGQIQNGK